MQPISEAEPCMPAVDISRNMADLMMHFLTLAGREATGPQPLTSPCNKLVSSMVLWDHKGGKEALPVPGAQAVANVAAVTHQPEEWRHSGHAGCFQLAARHHSARLQAVPAAGPKFYSRGQGPCSRRALEQLPPLCPYLDMLCALRF